MELVVDFDEQSLFEAKVHKLYEERIRKIENEQVRIISQLDHELYKLRVQLDQCVKAIERNSCILIGDGDLREGLIVWKNRIEDRHKMVMKVLTAIGTISLTALFELVREKIFLIIK